MENLKQVYIKTIFIIITLISILGIAIPVNAKLHLNQEEEDYIAEGHIIRAASIDGAAPLHYINSKGEISGIAVKVLEKIADMTGLIFEYQLYNSIEKTLDSDPDILFGITPQYAPEGMILSQPYLKSETILFMNSSLDPTQLEDKIYANIAGGSLPGDIREENTIYFGNREDTLEAVEIGRADYGYGNAYSLAYYILQNNYKNIITIPKGKEAREYSIGFNRENKILLSIINKSIEEIDDIQMQTLILDMASRVDRKLTFSMIMEAYGKKIFGLTCLVIGILAISVIYNIRANRGLKLQNRRYEILSNISNEYLFEYCMSTGDLELSEKSVELLEERGEPDKIIDQLKDILSNSSLEKDKIVLDLSLGSGAKGIYRVINSGIYDDGGELYSIIGKLVDISEEIAEKKQLINKAQIDGLTGLYNATTTREIIIENIENKDEFDRGAFILIDCDNFKYVNDTYGHLVGDEVLKSIGHSLKKAFRETDIIGRVGGDEFAIFIKDIPTIDLIENKYSKLSKNIQQINSDYNITVSAGAALLKNGETYEQLFKKAEKALYQAKENGRAQIAIYDFIDQYSLR